MKFPVSVVSLALVVASSSAFVPHHQRGQNAFLLPTAAGTRASLLSLQETQSSIERLPDSAVELTVTAPGAATKAAYDKACAEISQNIEIPGFRKGSKIPAQILEQAIRQNSVKAGGGKGGKHPLRAQAITALVNQLVEPTLKEHSLDPIGQPSMVVPVEEMVEAFVPGEDLTIKVKCDVWPEIKWAESTDGNAVYKGLTGSYERKPFDQAKLDKALSDLKERYASLQPIDDANHALQMGDACVVNMEGFMATADGQKGEPLPNAASGDRVDVILGEGRYMEGLVEGLLGAKVGDVVEVKVSFPDKLRDKTLAGKKAVFDVTVLEASKRTVPELTDEFAAKVKAGLTAESLVDELRKAVDQEDAKEYVGARNAALAKSLAEKVQVSIPDTLITNQARDKFAIMMAEMRDGGVSDEEIKNQIKPENFQKYKDLVKDDIIRDFRVSMATDEIARIEGIDIPDYQVEEQLEAIRKDAAQEGEEIDETTIRGKVEATLQRQAVFDFLADNANLDVKFKDEEFDPELMQQLAEDSLKRIEKETGVKVEDAEVSVQ